jgi:hypothetical protein
MHHPCPNAARPAHQQGHPQARLLPTTTDCPNSLLILVATTRDKMSTGVPAEAGMTSRIGLAGKFWA